MLPRTPFIFRTDLKHTSKTNDYIFQIGYDYLFYNLS